MSDQRLVDLETRVAFQEDTINQLNDVIVEMRSEIDRLRESQRRLLDQVQELRAQPTDVGVDPAAEVPPHY
jgi:SlyX protein